MGLGHGFLGLRSGWLGLLLALGETDGQTDGQTDGRIDRSKDGPKDEQTDRLLSIFGNFPLPQPT